MNWVPYDETNWDRLRDYPIVDYTGVSVETAEVFNKTLSELSEEYLSGITGIRVANPKEIPGATFFAQTQHHDQLSMNELLINPVKCRDKEKMVERIRALSDKGYCVMLPPGAEEQYIAVHEFAHGLLGLKESRKSLVGMDWKKTNRTRRELKAMYKEYMEEIRGIQAEIAELKKSPVLIDLNADPAEQMEAFRKLQDAQNRLKTVKISDYSMESADEFMAEAFTQHRIGTGRSKYTDRVMEVLDREYRLDELMKPADKPEKAAKAGKRKSKRIMTDDKGNRLFFNDSNYVIIDQHEWYPDAIPGSHGVKKLDRVFFNGEYHEIDGHYIKFNIKPNEKRIAELLKDKIGGPIYHRPEINQQEKIHSADIEFNKIEYDIKTLEPGPGKNKIYNRVKKKPDQAKRFIVDVSKTDLTDTEVDNQISKVFWSTGTLFVKELVIIRGDEILRIAKRI